MNSTWCGQTRLTRHQAPARQPRTPHWAWKLLGWWMWAEKRCLLKGEALSEEILRKILPPKIEWIENLWRKHRLNIIEIAVCSFKKWHHDAVAWRQDSDTELHALAEAMMRMQTSTKVVIFLAAIPAQLHPLSWQKQSCPSMVRKWHI